MSQQIGSELPHIETDPTTRSLDQRPAEIGTNYGIPSNEMQSVRATEQAAPTAAQPQFGAPAQQLANTQQTVYSDPGVATSSNPQIADDADLIEKEWVIKAKEIISRTKQDPYQQNKEVERVKVDYMKKRYNKDIKLTEE